MKRARQDSAAAEDGHTACNGTLRVLCSAGDFVVQQVEGAGAGAADFEDGMSTDAVDLVVHFRPPLEAARVPTAVLAVRYEGARHATNAVLLSQQLQPLEQGAPLQLRPQELEYRCFETYVAHVKQERLYALHLTVENATIGTGADMELRVQVNMRLHYLRNALGPERSAFLPWFPPNVDPAHWGLRVDPRAIPQRTPLWFKLRGEVSGSRAYVLLGWYVDSNNSRPMTAQQKSAMRLGTHSEDAILLAYCHRFPRRAFHEVGWCPASSGPYGIPAGWGASPDGKVRDPDMTWAALPPHVAQQYDPAEWDVTWGACEFKTSRTKLVVEPYFLAQVYMEMIALGVLWCDLVRYRPARAWDPEADMWRYDDTAHVYRVYRERALEERLVALWKHAHTNRHALVELTNKDERYVAIRGELAEAARRQEPYAVIRVAEEPALARALSEYTEYRCNATLPNAPVPAQSTPGVDWDALTVRLQEMRSMKRDAPRFKHLVAAQIQELASLLF